MMDADEEDLRNPYVDVACPSLPGDRMAVLPEERLMAAMIDRAVRDRLGPNKLRAREAEEWMASDSMETGSFGWVCFYLRLEPAYVRLLFAYLEPASEAA